MTVRRQAYLTSRIRRLTSEICTVTVGSKKLPLKAHQKVLPQSPILAALLKHKVISGQDLQRELPEHNSAVFCRIMQYLYGQRLPITESGGNGRIRKLREDYVIACQLELDVLQDIIIRTLDNNELSTSYRAILFADRIGYGNDQARPAFPHFFMRNLKQGIEKEGSGRQNATGLVVHQLISPRGTITKDITQVFQETHEEEDWHKSREAKLETEIEKANNKVAELEAKIEELRVDKTLEHDLLSEAVEALASTQRRVSDVGTLGKR